MAAGHSRYPVIGENPDDVVGVICLRDVLALEGRTDLAALRVTDVARTPVLVPASLPLPAVLDRLRAAGDEFAVVVDEYGGLAGVVTVEDIAEELVGEITDEHDPAGGSGTAVGDGEWTVPGTLAVEEVERLLDADLPEGDYRTIGGLVIDELQRLPEPGDAVRLTLANPSLSEEGEPPRALAVTVLATERRVPSSVRLAWADPEVAS
jgi:CBS domain containing-hemolysin-like protein